jgi:hypothetical protein
MRETAGESDAEHLVKLDKLSRSIESHRNSLLRFIEESVPHCELCDYSINGATCNCYKSRIPKP